MLRGMRDRDEALQCAVAAARGDLQQLRLLLSNEALQADASRAGKRSAHMVLAALEEAHESLRRAISARPVEAATLSHEIETQRAIVGPGALLTEAEVRLAAIRDADTALRAVLPAVAASPTGSLASPGSSSAAGITRKQSLFERGAASSATPSAMREATALRSRLKASRGASSESVRELVAAELAHIEAADAELLEMIHAQPADHDALQHAIEALAHQASPSVLRKASLGLTPQEAADAAIRRALAAGIVDELAEVLASERAVASKAVLTSAYRALEGLRADDALRRALLAPFEAKRMRDVVLDFGHQASDAVLQRLRVAIRRTEEADKAITSAMERDRSSASARALSARQAARRGDGWRCRSSRPSLGARRARDNGKRWPGIATCAAQMGAHTTTRQRASSSRSTRWSLRARHALLR